VCKMGFDWSSFTTNFLNTVSKGINERLEKQDDERDILNKEYDDARAVFNNRKKLVSGNMMLVGQARNLGANDMQIKAAISSGEAGLSTLVKAMQKHSSRTGRGSLTFPEVDTLVEGAELFEEGDVQEFLRRSYGLERDDDAPALVDDRSTLQRMFATGSPKTAAKLDFGADRVSMIELARQDAYDSLAPDRGSVYLTVDQARPFDMQEGVKDFIEEYQFVTRQIIKSDAYNAAKLKPPIKLPGGKEINATDAVIADAQSFVIERYARMGGQTFLDNIPPGIVDESLLALVQSKENITGKNPIGAKLLEAAAADMGTLVEEVKGDVTLSYNVDATGKIIGGIKFTRVKKDGTIIKDSIDPSDKANLDRLKSRGFNFDTMYEDDGTIEAAIKAIPEPSFLAGEPITEEVLPPAILGGQMTPLADERRDGDAEIEIPETKVDPEDTPSLFDDIGEFFREGGLSGRAEKRRREEAGETVEEKEEPVEEAPTDITVYGITSFGQQNFTVTPDGKVYINDRRTNKPKAEVTDPAVIKGVVEKNSEFVTGAIKTFVQDANDKGILNDKAKLMAYLKRFAGKNRLSAHVIRQVEAALIEELGL